MAFVAMLENGLKLALIALVDSAAEDLPRLSGTAERYADLGRAAKEVP